VLRNLEDLKKIGVRFVDFTGGEPLLHPDLTKMLRHAKKLGLITTVTTNCLLYPKRAKKMAGLVDLLHFSLDSPVAREHDSIRGVSSYAKVMQSIETAVSLGEKPDILFTMTDSNVIRLEEIIRFVQKKNLILIVNPVFEYFENGKADPATLDTVLSYASESNVYFNRGILRFMKHGGNRTSHPRCRAVTSTVVISPDDRLLFPCYHKAVAGIPIQGKLVDIHRGEMVRRFQKKEGRFDFCEGCTISCYFDPSFTVGMDDYVFLSLVSKAKYAIDKYLKKAQGGRT
jgi:MoaA/NifB/PqqE/SkfB family radical SAM enzyme